MSALSGASVPVPKMYLFCEDKTVMGQEFYVMEYIKVQLSTFDYYIAKSEKRALIVNLLIRNFSTSFSRNSKVFFRADTFRNMVISTTGSGNLFLPVHRMSHKRCSVFSVLYETMTQRMASWETNKQINLAFS